MNLSNLAPGARVECDIRGVRFVAKALSNHRGLIRIEPEESWPTWRFLKPQDILRELDEGESLRRREQ